MLSTFLLTSWSRVLLEKRINFQPVKKFTAFCGNRRFITACASARHLSLSKVSVQVRGFLYECFVTRCVLRWWVVSTSPNPRAGGPLLVGCPRLLIQYIHRYSPYWKPFLHPQPEDAPCRGDRDTLITQRLSINSSLRRTHCKGR
jgi:hypothetical protein